MEDSLKINEENKSKVSRAIYLLWISGVTNNDLHESLLKAAELRYKILTEDFSPICNKER